MATTKRNTKTKQLIFSLLQKSKDAVSHDFIEKTLKGQMDRVTVYRILQSFYDDGIVHKIIDNDGKNHYALCHSCSPGQHQDHHPHFHCLNCNEITCLEELTINREVPSNYTVSAVSSMISGYCSKCNNILKILCVFYFLLTGCFSVFSQTRIVVLDKSNYTPVKYANIYFPDYKTSVYTDSLGNFESSFHSNTVLTQISALGYQTLLLQISATPSVQTVYLQPSFHELQEIVVSANSSRLQGENVMNVEQITIHSADIQGISLSEKLSSVPGLSNFSTGSGIGKPVVRGLSGNRVAVFSQGVRIENQQWGDEHGLGLDENGYEQVEIIKGPASLLYGSDALGGVLYFSDERFAKQNSIETRIHSEFNSNTLGTGNKAALKYSEKKWHINLFGAYSTNKDYKDGNDNFVPNSRFNTVDFKTALGYTGQKIYSSLRYNYLHENYGLTELEEVSEEYEKNRTPFSPYQNLTTHILASENTVPFDNSSKLKIDLGYVFNNRKEIEDDVAELNMNLHTFSYNIKWSSAKIKNHWEFTAGSQGMFQENKNLGEETLIPDAETVDFGFFVVSNCHFSEKSFWQSGIRFDNRFIQSSVFSKNYPAFNFSTGIFQPITKSLFFRANISSGFRSPNMFELMSDGVHEGTNRYEKGNLNLKTENSYQVDASLNYGSKHLEIFVNPYFNYIRNFIYVQPAGAQMNDVPLYNYLQNNAILYGSEAGFHFHPHPLDWLHLESSYSSAFGQLQAGENLPLMPSQKIKSTTSANFARKTCLRKISVYIQHIYSFAQNKVSDYETITPDYNLFNAGFAFEFQIKKQNIQLNFAANNLLNEKYYDHLSRYKSEGILNMGRNFNVKVTLIYD